MGWLANLLTKADVPVPAAARDVAASATPGNDVLSIVRSNEEMVREYVRSIYLWRCIDMISSMAASVPLKVGKDNDESQLTREQSDIAKLLVRPNPQWSGHAMQYYVAASIAVANKAYILRVPGAGNSTQELWPLAASGVQPIYHFGSRMLKEYLVSTGGEQKSYPVDAEGHSDVIAIRRPSLCEEADRSPAVIAAPPAEVFTRILQRCYDIVRNSSNITGVLSTDSELSIPAVEKVKNMIKKFATGHEESGGVMVTANAKWNLTRLSEDPSSALSTSIKDSLARDIVMTFGVPSQLVGLPGTDTYNNVASARVGFLTDTVLPGYIGLYCAALNHALMKNGAQIKPDVEQIPAMIAGRREMIDMASRASMLSINEQRKMLGYPKFIDTDKEVSGYVDPDVPIKLEELRLKRLAIEAQMQGAGGGLPASVGRVPGDQETEPQPDNLPN